jgi:acetyl esterase/lipase
MVRSRLAIAVLLLGLCVYPGRGAETPPWTRTEDVIYARKYGVALTLDVFTPKRNANGAAVVFVISGGWFSSHEAINDQVIGEFLKRGYTVFAVVHGSQPKFTIPEIIEDMHRAVRFVHYRAKDYRVDPNRIGITGGSAGGHLSLMIGMAGRKGDPDAKDPVDRESSRVQAVGCYFPPTDFLNYGQPGRDVFKALEAELSPFKAPFDFQELDPKARRFVLITDEAKRLQIARDISPITYVTADDPPTLIFHGDADKLVPIQQSQAMERSLKAAGVPVKLVVKAGQGHGWADWIKDMAILADWFDVYLKEGNPPASQPSVR